jgi:uncharacterized protein
LNAENISAEFSTGGVISKIIIRTFLVSAILLIPSAFPVLSPFAEQAQKQPAVVNLSADSHVIRAEVALSAAQREKGLMYRPRLGRNEGMLFDYKAPTDVCMWMKNTLIPLSVAFIDSGGVIVNIEDMEPHTTDFHCSTRPVRFALEMNRGWFAARNIKTGDRIRGLPD